MKEVYYASSPWVELESHAFESEIDCMAFAKERIISKVGELVVEENECYEPGWLGDQFEVYCMDFHREGQY